MAVVYGVSITMSCCDLSTQGSALAGNPFFRLGLLLVVLGLGFKIAAFPLQIWAPDFYQGSPAPTTAFLAVGSKAAGFFFVLRLLFPPRPPLSPPPPKPLLTISTLPPPSSTPRSPPPSHIH